MIRECKRCGTCCRKGPPALHSDDVGLYTDGILSKDALVTLRKGEWVHDSVQDALMTLPGEIVRIKAGPGGQRCLFLSDEENTCRIYDRRPAECRAMKCWAPAEFEAMYQRDRIDRTSLIPADSALGEIIVEHEECCAYEIVRPLAEEVLRKNDQQAAAELAAVIQQDADMRSFIQERTGAEESVLDFIFGRPLTRTLPGFGLRVECGQGGYRFHMEGNVRLRRLLLA